MNFTKVTLLLLLAFFSIQIQAQTETVDADDKLSLDSGSIENQFEYLTKKSNGWKDQRGQRYEVIKVQWIEKIKKNTLDSLKAVHITLNDTKAIVTKQDEEISKLKTSLSSTKGTLEQTNTEKDSMSLFGIQMSKGGYNGLMWSIIGGLLALALFFMYRFKSSNSITKEAQKSLAETEEEFEDHRRIALEREQKVRRQLQDERNKHKNSN
ncbi:tRNA (guanine-N1)-methyltransferase [Lacinutrix sp. Bg11-31]|uniref:tRNA (guanine-N1)-methyltransferase n=1 Tax=Lacinutrix sp. Bg11-31 TaxID=2057808 RepID=UPI000C30F4D6|nr:tRNA (guanine-N1)-methyltransferase [Lacinutrix sp. Bg11-31]AUC81946.1 tRNA (guanine-N1)-methyltransferase [Lacinutrix sp. Bg11-31]